MTTRLALWCLASISSGVAIGRWTALGLIECPWNLSSWPSANKFLGMLFFSVAVGAVLARIVVGRGES